MAYNQKLLDAYRQLHARGEPFRSATCPYCNGQRDATVKHTHPSTKPADAWSFWNDVLIKKYAPLQSAAARRNLQSTAHFGNNAADMKEEREDHAGTSSPRMLVVGPMVDQSELPFRMLCREYGATLAYTPMLHAKSFAESAAYRAHFLGTTPPAEVRAAMEKACASAGAAAKTSSDTLSSTGFSPVREDTQLVDRPCIVQFCGNDADTVVAAARYAVLGEGADAAGSNGGDKGTRTVYPVRVRFRKTAASAETEEEGEGEENHLLFGCDAVDLNLGCPQGIARRGHYGSFLMEDWELIHNVIHALHVELEVPVTVKMRVFSHPRCSDVDSAGNPLKDDFDEALTILYARMIRDAGAQLLCVHGRTREMKGQQTGAANMELIRRVHLALQGSIPVISNGNVYTYEDVWRNLRDTQCEGIMCAEPLLWDPTLFSNPSHPVMPGRTHGADKATRLSALRTALRYMAWVRRYPVDIGFVKAHLFKMCFHSYELHAQFREALGQLKTNAASMRGTVDGEEPPSAELKSIGLGTSAITCGSVEAASMEVNVGEGAASEVVDAIFNVTLKSPQVAFEQYVDAIEAHLRKLMEAEQQSSVEGEQPKIAQAEKFRAKQEVVDVWAEEDGLGIDF
ncbi:putative dihydrouridine synthase (Dus) [Leptomonas seymouri]|uniref:tRNA-dihydrouridine(16/17) synthase [NAD(P)(+)] n=1 Tax=Leptomonas seymouri TaxID=5684 RepID=A0A0N1HS31_LEPSE|nr:putative dihydrouridine synthase (Dus) [Leptomonas seymouri]|eukprot:KPI83310.1 putative dihydrouridine synthase (Dus) [Leptomonas seymouri]